MSMKRYAILHVPTVAVFSGGQVVSQVIGARSKSAFLREFARIIEPAVA
jgi:thioredoxin-like negative regulator of GroEL